MSLIIQRDVIFFIYLFFLVKVLYSEVPALCKSPALWCSFIKKNNVIDVNVIFANI